MIELPDAKSVKVSLYGRTVGRLALTPDGVCAFQYDAAFAQNGYSISPLKLPLTPELFIAGPQPFDGGFGVFDDSLPDGWGRLVQDRFLRANGVDPDRLTVLQRLLLIGSDARGALSYELPEDGSHRINNTLPPASSPAPVSGSEIEALAGRAKLLTTENSRAGESMTNDDFAALYRFSGSSGGARPKAFLYMDGKEWLVKFHASDDPADIGEIEYRTSLLAKNCGIEMPETRLFEGRYFGAARFDRTPEGKIHAASAAGLLNADYRIPSLDYTGLLALCRILTRDMAEVEQLFTRMVFNVIIGNRDDHAKNFAFLMNEQGEWRLSPAYDLLPSYGFGGYHTTTANGSSRPKRADLLAVASAAGVPEKKAGAIIKRIEERITEIKF